MSSAPSRRRRTTAGTSSTSAAPPEAQALTGRHLRRFAWAPSSWEPPDLAEWPFTVPAVAQLVADGGLDIPTGVTFLVGENGSGKSTLIEAFGAAYPFGPNIDTGPGPSPEDSSLHLHLRAVRSGDPSPHGFVLRAEAMHPYLGAKRAGQRGWGDRDLATYSHGESFLTVLRLRCAEIGVYFLDEPEAALSFRSCLGLVALLDQMAREGSQVVVATHSPLLLSLPGATCLELGDHGVRRVAYDDLELVRDWRDYLASPARWLRHLLEDEDG